MKKILLLSDTHGYLDEHILRYVNQVDEVWHAGDIGHHGVTDQIAQLKPLKVVYGNIDDNTLRSEYPKDLHFECEGMRVWMTHIGGRPPRYAKGIIDLLKSNKPHIFVCGHSHILKVYFDKTQGVLYLNPGAAGIRGIHTIRTMLRFEIDQAKIKKMEVIELNSRSKT